MKYRDIFYVFDDPVPFKTNQGDIDVHPLTMRDYYKFMGYADCLTQDKNSISSPDIMTIISMPYLEYIFKYTNDENFWVAKLFTILSMVFRVEYEKIQYGFLENKRPFIFIDDKIVIDCDNFDDLKDLICEQNEVEIEDYTVSKEVRDALKDAQRFKTRNSGVKMAGLEDQVLCLIASTSLSIEDVSKLTIRKFVRLLDRVDAKLHYEIYLGASMSGMVEFKDKSFIKHWMSDLSKDTNKPDNILSVDSVKKNLEKI
jgi:hypothetical protein